MAQAPPPTGDGTLSAHPLVESRPTEATAPGSPVSTGQAVWLILLNELVPGVIAILIVSGVVWSAVVGRVVPEVLSNLAFGIVAFYFGVRGRGPVTIGR